MKIIKSIKARRKRKKLTVVSINRLIPNAITIAALCMGFTSVKYGLIGNLKIAITLVLIACILDVLDGKIARMLNATSEFGKSLDSISDVINFGVAPSLIIYYNNMYQIKIGWGVVLFYLTCTALRLARFNIEEIPTEPQQKQEPYFFTGVPSPAGALLMLLPLMLNFSITEIVWNSYVFAVYIILIGFLMVSKLPTMSLKNLNIKKKFVPYILLFFGALTISTSIEPWITIPLLIICYLFSIPLTFLYKLRLNFRKEASNISIVKNS